MDSFETKSDMIHVQVQPWISTSQINLPMELTEIMYMTMKSLSASAVQEIKVFRGTQQEYSSKPLKHSIVKRILVFKR